MTLDQQINLWNAIGTWLAAVATFCAVVTSLWLANRQRRIELVIQVTLSDHLVYSSDGSRSYWEQSLDFRITNISDRNVTVVNVGWSIKPHKLSPRREIVQALSEASSSKLPGTLEHGRFLELQYNFDDTNYWPRELRRDFLRTQGLKRIEKLMVFASTSIGKKVYSAPGTTITRAITRGPLR